MDSSKTKKTELPFEEGLKRLGALVDSMEKGKLPLEEMVKNYEEGVQLLEKCQSQLKSAEMKILQMKKSDKKGGEPTLELFNE